MPLAGNKLIKIEITIPFYGDMMDTYDYARDCIDQLLGGAWIPDLKIHWSVERVEENKKDSNGYRTEYIGDKKDERGEEKAV